MNLTLNTEVTDEDREFFSGFTDTLDLFRTPDITEGCMRLAQFMKDTGLFDPNQSTEEILSENRVPLESLHGVVQAGLSIVANAVDQYLGKPNDLEDDRTTFVDEIVEFTKPQTINKCVQLISPACQEGNSQEAVEQILHRCYHLLTLQNITNGFTHFIGQNILAKRFISMREYRSDFPCTTFLDDNSILDVHEDHSLLAVAYIHSIANIAVTASNRMINGKNKGEALTASRSIPPSAFAYRRYTP